MTNIEFMRKVVGKIIQECDPAAVAAAYKALMRSSKMRLVNCTWEEAKKIMKHGGEAYGRSVHGEDVYAKCQIDAKGQQLYFDGTWYADKSRWSLWAWKKTTFDTAPTRLGPYTSCGKWGIPHLSRLQSIEAGDAERSAARAAIEDATQNMRSAPYKVQDA